MGRLVDVDTAVIGRLRVERAGQVDLDALSKRTRNNFSFVHSVIGRGFATPAARGGEVR
jgi:hypothetical protein